ncbi:MAG: hypothetical protein RLN62_02370 [Rickettsiales bacterium]
MNNKQNKTEDEKTIEKLFYTYMMIMSNENSFGMNIACSTLRAVSEEEFNQVISAFRDEKDLEKTVKSILLALRELNKNTDNEATTLAIITSVKRKLLNLQADVADFEAKADYNTK